MERSTILTGKTKTSFRLGHFSTAVYKSSPEGITYVTRCIPINYPILSHSITIRFIRSPDSSSISRVSHAAFGRGSCGFIVVRLVKVSPDQNEWRKRWGFPDSMGWLMGKSTGNCRFSHELWYFPVIFPLNQSIDRWDWGFHPMASSSFCESSEVSIQRIAWNIWRTPQNYPKLLMTSGSSVGKKHGFPGKLSHMLSSNAGVWVFFSFNLHVIP